MLLQYTAQVVTICLSCAITSQLLDSGIHIHEHDQHSACKDRAKILYTYIVQLRFSDFSGVGWLPI